MSQIVMLAFIGVGRRRKPATGIGEEMRTDYDVIVIGAGFAGATAARECATRGLRTLVLEARGRTGGRTCTRRLSSGHPVDLGGTYVRWNQPHTWNEISRYGLEEEVIAATVPADRLTMVTDDGSFSMPANAIRDAQARGFAKFTEQAAEIFPAAGRPFWNREAIERIDGMSVKDRRDALGEDGDVDAVYEFLVGSVGGDAAEASYTQVLRMAALGEYNWKSFDDHTRGFKLKCGIGGLHECIIGDGGAEVRLNQPVSSISESAGAVTVTLTNGTTLIAGAAVVTVPINVWPDLQFSPALPEKWLALAGEGVQARSAAKGAALIKGESQPVQLASLDGAVASADTYTFVSEDTQILTLFPGAAMTDPDDIEQWRKGVARLLPHVEIVDLVRETYLPDNPYARGGWGCFKPGQLTTYAPHEIRRNGTRTLFAGAELATVCVTFIDGAIETGMRAGRSARALVEGDWAASFLAASGVSAVSKTHDAGNDLS